MYDVNSRFWWPLKDSGAYRWFAVERLRDTLGFVETFKTGTFLTNVSVDNVNILTQAQTSPILLE